jgi:membrane protein YdbS with pleckstrin-like domain
MENMTTMTDMRTQPVMGVIPPQVAEARMVLRWPSVTRFAAPARLGNGIIQAAKNLVFAAIRMPFFVAAILVLPATILAALISLAAYLLLAPLYFSKVLPFMMTRYVVTNRRIMIQKGWSLTPAGEVPLEEVQEVRVVPGSEQPFYLAADLEIIANGKAALRLAGVPEYKHFKVQVENAYLAWGRKDPPKEQAYPAVPPKK